MGTLEPVARIAESGLEHHGPAADTNHKGVRHGLGAALPVMESEGSGAIVNIGSGAAASAHQGWSHACSTKAAVLSLQPSLMAESMAEDAEPFFRFPGTSRT